MVRTKATPAGAGDGEPGSGENSLLGAPAGGAAVASSPLSLRVRGPSGVQTLALRSDSTLGDLVAAAEAGLGGRLSHASFRGDDGRPVTLLSEGAYPAGGALLVGPDTPVALVGLDARALVSVQVAAPASTKKKKTAAPPRGPAKKARRSVKGDDDDDDDGDGEYVDEGAADDDDDEGGAADAAAARRLLGGNARAVLQGGASVGDDAATVAANFVNANESSDTLMSSAAAMWVSQQGALRVEAAAKPGLVRLEDAGRANLAVFWKHSSRVRRETEERVRRFSPAETVDVVVAILHRQAGTRRRKLAGDAPSTRLLTPPSVASRCPALFWSLYANSRPSDDAPGDVVFALDHVLGEARARYDADVEALRQSAAAS